MDHNDIRHKLSEYLDGSVTAGEKSSIEEHLKSCAACSAALEELRKTVEHIRTAEEVEPPAWMTQKIMAKVRSGAGPEKSFFRRLFYPLSLKLPVQAVAVLFLTVLAFYAYQNREPLRLSEAPAPEITVKTEAAPSRGKADQFRPGDSALRSKRAPQAPEYKALDMKGEYEKPAPPKLADETAPEKPVEQPMPAKKETRGFAPQASAPVMAENQAAPAGGTSVPAEKKSAAAPGMMKSKTATEVKFDKVLLTLTVRQRTDTVQKVEALLARMDGKVTRKEAVTNANVLTIELNAADMRKFAGQLRELGALKENDMDTTRLSGTVTIELLIVNPLPQSR